MDQNAIWIGNDQRGYELKLKIVAHIRERGLVVRDVGTDSTDFVRYPHYAAQVAAAVSGGRARRGILICATGIGMSIMANKFPGVRAALCTSSYMARITRAHNDSNILCLGGGITGWLEALDMVDAWLDTPYDGGRHMGSLALIAEAERAIATHGTWEPPVG